MREIAAKRGVMFRALAASLVTHAALLLVARLPALRESFVGQADPGASEPQVAAWAGTTPELPGGGDLYDISLVGAPQAAAAEPAVPVAPTEPTEPAVSVPAPAAPQAAAPETNTPAPQIAKPDRRTASKPEPPALPDPLGEPSSPRKPPPSGAAALGKPSTPPKPRPDDEDPYEDPPTPEPRPGRLVRSHPASSRVPSTSAVAGRTESPATAGASGASGADSDDAPSSAGSAPSAGLGGKSAGGAYGVVGIPGVRDLGLAFTQRIPPACDSDAIWGSVPLGDAGSILVAIAVNEGGRITDLEILDKSPPKALENVARRTVAMLQSGTYALRPGAVSAGRQIVRISANVKAEQPEDVKGGQMQLTHDSYSGGVGRSHFIRNGRRVDLTVRMLRVE